MTGADGVAVEIEVPVLAVVLVGEDVEVAVDVELLLLLELAVPFVEDPLPDAPGTGVEVEAVVLIEPVLAPLDGEGAEVVPVVVVVVPLLEEAVPVGVLLVLVFTPDVVFVPLADPDVPLPVAEPIVPVEAVVGEPADIVGLVDAVFVALAVLPLLAVDAGSLLAGVDVEAVVVPVPPDALPVPVLVPADVLAVGAGLLPVGDAPLAVLVPEVALEAVLAPLVDVPVPLGLELVVVEPVDAVLVPLEDVPAVVLLPLVGLVPVALVVPA